MLVIDQKIRNAVTKTQAIRAVELVKNHITGGEQLTTVEIETYRAIIKEYSKDMYFFCKYVLGYGKISAPHRRWIDDLISGLGKKRNTIRLKPRGTFKTTIYGCGFILWAWALLSVKIRFFYASANQKLLEEVSSEIRGQLEGSVYELIFQIKLDATEKNTGDVINLVGREGKGFSLVIKTSGSSTAGLHPHFIIVDDPSDERDREFRNTRESKYRWADSLVPLIVSIDIPLQSGEVLILKHQMWIATRWHMEDVIHYLEKKNDNLDDDDKFDVEVESVEVDGIPQFPEIHDEKEISYLRKNLPDVVFSCQYMNKPVPEGSLIFDIDRLHFRSINEIDIKRGVNYCFLDPSKGKKESDYPMTIFVNKQNGKLFIFDAIDTRILLADLLPVAAMRCKEYKCHTFHYEGNGSTLIDTEMKRLFKEIKYNCIINEINEGRNKNDRIVNSQPTLYSGDVLFREDYKKIYPEGMAQLVNYPAWGNDDFPDVVEKSINTVGKEKEYNARWV